MSFGTGNPAQTFTVNDPTSITVTAPAGAVGTVDVTVTTSGGGTSPTNAPNDQFTYVVGPPPPPTITVVNPKTGPAGTLVTVSGTNFTNASAVNFGPGNPATTSPSTTTTPSPPPRPPAPAPSTSR